MPFIIIWLLGYQVMFPLCPTSINGFNSAFLEQHVGSCRYVACLAPGQRPMDESLVPVVVRSLTGDVLLELRTEDGTTLRQLAKQVRSLKGEGSWLGVTFMCHGELMASSSTIANVLARMEQAEPAELTAVLGEMSLADVMDECNLVFLKTVDLEFTEGDVILQDLDSFCDIELRQALQDHFEVFLGPAVLYEFPTLKEVSDHIRVILHRRGGDHTGKTEAQ